MVVEPMRVKIGNFDIARLLKPGMSFYEIDNSKSNIVTPIKWAAPEVWGTSKITGKFTHKSDVWSFGVMVWEVMAKCQLPYLHKTDSEVSGMPTYWISILWQIRQVSILS